MMIKQFDLKNIKINLQLFAGEKTERATSKRRQEARKKGQVAKSNEVTTVFVLAMSFLILQIWLPQIGVEFANFFGHLLRYMSQDLSQETSTTLILETLFSLGKMVGPIILTAVVAGYVANVLQVGFIFSTESIKFDLKKISPVNGLKRIFSKRALSELVKSVLKTCLVGYVAFTYLWKQLSGLSLLMDAPLFQAMKLLSNVAFSAGWRVILVLFILAIADYAYQLYEYERSLKMSKQDIKDEYKTTEGDPLLKAKIKEKQRQLAMKRMMQEVPNATVVITNPTHIAVAIKYEDDMEAPILVAKGQDLIAEKIKEIALENQVAIVENKPLARALNTRVKIGMSIPFDLYQAVAEVIAYVYRLKKRL